MAKEHLVKARELIEAGWTKTELEGVRDGKVCFCLDGALAKAHGVENVRKEAYSFLMSNPEAIEDVKVVFDVLPDSMYKRHVNKDSRSEEVMRGLRMDTIWHFNDETATTQEDVIAVLDAAIEKAE